MEKEKKYVWVVKQPSHSIVSFVRFTKVDGPIEPHAFCFLEELSKKSDIIFIFPSGSELLVDRQKLTSLYNGCAYTTENNDDVVNTILFAIQYVNRVFQRHLSYILFKDLQSFPEKEERFFHNLDQFNMSNSLSAVCEVERLSPDRLYDIYRIRESDKVIVKIPWWKRLHGESKTREEIRTNIFNLYAKYEVISGTIFFKVGHINALLDSYEKDDRWLANYSLTFGQSDNWNLFFGSYIKMSGTALLNKDIEKFNIGNL
jgi:hypothetical protein